jgi:broad specificity phosphatase PhoE
MATTDLYFVRHGETEYNRRRIVQGRKIDSTLNDTGRRQAEALAERLASLDPVALYTSTLRRALQTTDRIAERHPGVPVYRTEDLEEMSWGVHEGDAPSDATDAIYGRWDRGEFDYQIDGGESIRDVQERALRAVRRITSEHPGATVIVVAHGRLLRVLLASLLNEYGLERMSEIEHDNTGVNHLRCRADSYEACLLNCTAHLEKATVASVE